MNRLIKLFFVFCLVSIFASQVYAYVIGEDKAVRRDQDIQQLQERFKWWPTDAKPAPVKDEGIGGYWWWPAEPGQKTTLWGNRGFIYVFKIIFDYSDEVPKEQEMRPSLVIKKIIKNVKIYFDFNKAALREDHNKILTGAIETLKRNPETNILITGNCDVRGSEGYNIKLGKRRAAVVKEFMLNNGISEDHIKIVSRGKLDAVARVKDIVGMQKDRNAQFMIAQVEEVMIPKENIPQEDAQELEEGKYLIEKEEQIESEVKVSTRKYTIKKNDTLWDIAQSELGNGHRWEYLYEFNKDIIKNPKKLKAGQVILIPVE